MNFRIPFTLSSVDKLKKRSKFVKSFIKYKKYSKLQDYLNNTDSGLLRDDYMSIALYSLLKNFLVLFVIAYLALFFLKIKFAFLLAFAIAYLVSVFILMNQILYPKLYSNRRQREIERNLIPALQDMLVQLNSGIPLFSILVNISSSDYSALSDEFKKAVKKINAGLPQIDVLEELGEKNPSIYFRRALWQISNGMRAGSDISIVIRESVKSLNEEQVIQIQNYGNKLNPVIMFYMLIAVVIPALSITFLTIISSLINLSKTLTTILFITLGFFVLLIQVMFLGTIRSMRPSLL